MPGERGCQSAPNPQWRLFEWLIGGLDVDADATLVHTTSTHSPSSGTSTQWQRTTELVLDAP